MKEKKQKKKERKEILLRSAFVILICFLVQLYEKLSIAEDIEQISAFFSSTYLAIQQLLGLHAYRTQLMCIK